MNCVTRGLLVCFQVKCHRYWPSEGSRLYGVILVELVEEASFGDYISRKFKLTHTEVCHICCRFASFQLHLFNVQIVVNSLFLTNGYVCLSVCLFVCLFMFLLAFVFPCFARSFWYFRARSTSFWASEKSQPTQTSEQNHHSVARSNQFYFILQLLQFYNFLTVCLIPILLCIIFTIVALQEKDSRTVCQFQYTDWPDTGLPDSGVGIVDLIGQVQKWQQQSGNTAIVLHCRWAVPSNSMIIKFRIQLTKLDSINLTPSIN